MMRELNLLPDYKEWNIEHDGIYYSIRHDPMCEAFEPGWVIHQHDIGALSLSVQSQRHYMDPAGAVKALYEKTVRWR